MQRWLFQTRSGKVQCQYADHNTGSQCKQYFLQAGCQQGARAHAVAQGNEGAACMLGNIPRDILCQLGDSQPQGQLPSTVMLTLAVQ